ncbi:MAG: hypothetical protein GXP62_11980 [Oligoflexia bacterium]|nr:hypothetical protein [Oligoflexia bacterium]
MATTPVMTAIALAIAIGALAFYDGRDKGGETGSKSAAVASAIGVLLVAWVIWSVAGDRTPLVSGELQGDVVLNVPAQDTRVSLLVHADLPRVKTGQSSGGDYRLDVRVGEKVLDQLDGEVSETWRRGRAGRRGHTENLVAQPAL